MGEMRRNAHLSDDEVYRYWLGRRWNDLNSESRAMLFVMLNPSTADAKIDDATIRRCVNFAKREEFTEISVVNLYAYRATDPLVLWQKQREGIKIIGQHNDDRISIEAVHAEQIVVAWGAIPGFAIERSLAVLELLRKFSRSEYLYCLGTTQGGYPRHPVRLASATPFETYTGTR